MANIQERRDKSGKLISYSIRVHRGRDVSGKQLKPYTATFEVSPTWTEKSARKKAEAFAATFEKQCKEGTATDCRQTFSAYCDYVIALKEQRGIKHSTIVRYRTLAKRVCPYIGHIKLKDLRADHLNSLYTELAKSGARKSGGKAVKRINLDAVLREKKITRTQIAEQFGVSLHSVSFALRGDVVNTTTAQAVSNALSMKLEDAFTILDEGSKLSTKTIAAHHGLISTVLEQAVKDGLVPTNVASRAMPPKVEHKPINYFQPDTVTAIRDALEGEPLKWKTLVHLLLISGARRGEILGLKWPAVDFERNQIHICNTVQYTPDRGVYEDSPKTAASNRFVSLPTETMQLLKQYKTWQTQERLRLGSYYQDQGFLFCREDGKPINPSGIEKWLRGFSNRHGLPHINPHAFRHTMASMLYFNGVDSVSISKRLGHTQVSTTANIYAHVIEEADIRNAEILSDIFLKKA